ncbi:MAG: glycosyltransferase [Dolichospermum sp. LBC05a]|nr:glycosyltransferase [Dolichospermum sp. OL01]MCO5796398.1 glycosyltransferase [Dolichospermum sp. OL03]MCS6281606.1 glycosyltransferase [Dolichospermum sp.]QSV58007.1 MAG: glycosyltransferase [Dolichospermum sp. LBC05a]
MNILIITPYISSSYGGISKIVIEFIQEISKLGIKVDLITTNADPFHKLNVPLNTWITKENYRVQYFSCWHRNDLIISYYMIKWLFFHITDYDIIHSNTIFSPLISTSNWICQLRKIPYLITPHGMLEPWALSYKGWKKRLYFALIEKPSLQKSRTIQVNSSSEENSIKSLGIKSPIVIIPNGVHRQEFENLPDPDLFYQQFPHTRNKTLILFLGRIDPKKGLDLLAPAFAKVYNQFPQTHLIVAGPDSIGFLPTAKSYFTQAGCLEAVTFTGMLTGELKLATLAAANIYIAPSYSEGFSMSVLEGMATGLPCVITTGCNFPEAGIADAAKIVNTNHKDISDALIELLQDADGAKKMGDRARQFILDNYTWDKIALKMVSVYEDIIFRSPTSF